MKVLPGPSVAIASSLMFSGVCVQVFEHEKVRAMVSTREPERSSTHYAPEISSSSAGSTGPPLALPPLQAWAFEGQPGSVEWAILEEACAELDKLWRLVEDKIKVRPAWATS